MKQHAKPKLSDASKTHPSTAQLSRTFSACLVLLAVGCTLHAPAVNHELDEQEAPWLIHCETATTYEEDPEEVAGADNKNWVFATNEAGEKISLKGELVDGFLEVTAVQPAFNKPDELSRIAIRQLCLDTISKIERDEELMLGWVMAARVGEKVNIPPVYPKELLRGDKVTRVVIFGDSLTDSGRLKERLWIFPAKPYWLGRFSNGPVWPEYLAMATGMGIQNHAYGGASAAEQEVLPGASLYARIRDYGQFFVSGTIELQINDYLEQTLAEGKIEREDTTAFLIWGGANDYISKEPLTGVITTFLNSPEGEAGYKTVVKHAVSNLAKHVHTLHDAGARRFILVNLPDLGVSPIVLQNTTYERQFGEASEVARKIELVRRLTELTRYHNTLLAAATDHLRQELPASEVLLIDAYSHFQEITGLNLSVSLKPERFGYDPHALAETLLYQDKKVDLQRPCYSGPYLGTDDPDTVCEKPEQALFWDTVHPTTITHCWQAWNIANNMASAGWIQAMPDPASYRSWCQTITEQVTMGPANRIETLN